MPDRRGERIIEAAVGEVLRELSQHPKGMRNVELAQATGLDLPVRAQKHYISYTILMYLVEQGRVLKEGRVYRLASE